MPNEALPKQLNYQRNMYLAPKYRFSEVSQFSNARTEITAGANPEMLQYKFPAGTAFNLSKSSFSYNVHGGQQALDTHLWIANDCFQIAQSLQIVTVRGGIVLVDLQDLNRYSKIVDKYYTSKTDFLSRATVDMSPPCNDLRANNPTVPTVIPADNAYGLAAGPHTGGYVDYNEAKYFAIAPSRAPFGIAKTVKFSDFGRSTLLELDKDICFGEDVYLNLWIAPKDRFCFTSLSQAAAVGPPPVPAIDGSKVIHSAASAANIKISNIIFNLAIQDNKELAQKVVDKYNAHGITLPTDFLSMSKNSLGAPKSNLQITILQMPNSFLKRNINFVFNGDESLSNMYNSTNINGSKIKKYQTVIDQKQLQNQQITCEMSTYTELGNIDYRENERFIKDSAIQGVPMYQHNWVHIDEFSSDNALEKHKEYNDSNAVTGLDLNIPRVYQLQMETPNAAAVPLSMYTYSVVSKQLKLGPNDITFV